MPTVLDELLAVYRKTPSAELHALILRASAALASATPDTLRGRLKAALELWIARAKSPTTADVPALLETLADGGSRVAVVRMTAVNKWPADPRVDEQIVKWFENAPWEGDIAKPFWRLVFQRIEKIRDPDVQRRLAEAPIGNVDSMMWTWLGNARNRAVAAMKLYDAKSGAGMPSKLVMAVDAAIEKLEVSPATRSEADLLDAIRKHPDDTATRMVYADTLVAKEDPYGEFIAIQCSPQDPKRAKRAAALLKKHGNAWLGPLVNVVMKNYVFERGFLSRCCIASAKRAKVPPLVGHPAWSTVRAISGSTAIALHPSMISLRELGFSGYEDRKAWRNLLVEVERPIEHLAFSPSNGYRDAIERDEFAALGECAALPRLKSLSIACTIEEFTKLLGKPIAKRLHGIRATSLAGGYVYQGEPWIGDIIRLTKVPVLELYVQVMLRVERAGDVTLTLREPRQHVDVAIAMVPHLPETARRVLVRATGNIGVADRQRVDHALRARFGDRVVPAVVIPDEIPNQVDVAI